MPFCNNLSSFLYFECVLSLWSENFGYALVWLAKLKNVMTHLQKPDTLQNDVTLEHFIAVFFMKHFSYGAYAKVHLFVEEMRLLRKEYFDPRYTWKLERHFNNMVTLAVWELTWCKNSDFYDAPEFVLFILTIDHSGPGFNSISRLSASLVSRIVEVHCLSVFIKIFCSKYKESFMLGLIPLCSHLVGKK